MNNLLYKICFIKTYYKNFVNDKNRNVKKKKY